MSELCVPGTRWKCKAFTDEKLTFPASAMNRYARAWNLFLCANILPSSHSHEVTVERAIMLWAILNEEYIDLGYVIHQSMLRFMRGGTTGAISHASIVVKLCTAVGVQWAEVEQLQLPSAPIYHSTIARMTDWEGGVPHGKGFGYVYDEVAGGRPESHVRDEGPSGVQQTGVGVGVGMGDAQFRRLARRMDAMHDIHSRFSVDLTSALAAIFGATGVDVQWPVFVAGLVYPPPDTPPAEGDLTDD